jgi:predicted NUDIX family NTP pyrophosphohydrolase
MSENKYYRGWYHNKYPPGLKKISSNYNAGQSYPPSYLYNTSTIVCLNCEIQGHTFKDCKKPIVSYGIILYKKTPDGPKFLLIQRRDTVAYIDFLRGKYNLKYKGTFKILIEEMTNDERQRLLKYNFITLWDNLWINKSKTYINEFLQAKEKFEKLDIHNMVNNTSKSIYSNPSIGLTKGRSKLSESPKVCALREFVEESGISAKDIEIKNVNPLEELYYGSNSIAYRHVYYIAEMKTDHNPVVDQSNLLQIGEIGDIGWFSFKEAINSFRLYHSGKRNIIYTANKIISNL